MGACHGIMSSKEGRKAVILGYITGIWSDIMVI